MKKNEIIKDRAGNIGVIADCKDKKDVLIIYMSGKGIGLFCINK